jgi:hypothetical protein
MLNMDEKTEPLVKVIDPNELDVQEDLEKMDKVEVVENLIDLHEDVEEKTGA